MACVPVECVGSEVFASRTCEIGCSTCCCPTAIIQCQLMLSSIVWRSYRCACMIPLWCRPNQWCPLPQKYGKRSLQRHLAWKEFLFSVLSGPWGFPSHFHTTSCIWSGKISSWTSSSSGLATIREWMRVSHMSWIHIFGRLLVLPPQKPQKQYLLVWCVHT